MASSRRSPSYFIALSYCLLSSLLTAATAFSVPSQIPNTTISPVYQTSQWSNVSTSFLTQVRSLETPPISSHNVVATHTRVRVIDIANFTGSLAPQIVSTTSMDPTSSPIKMNTTIPGTLIHVTKTESQSPADKTKSAISQKLVSYLDNATSPTVALTTANTTTSYTLKTMIRAPSSSESPSMDLSTARSSSYLSSSSLSSHSSMPSDLNVTFSHAPTSAIVISSSASSSLHTTVAPPIGTASAFPSATQGLNSTSGRVATPVVKVVSSKSGYMNPTITESACTSCASSFMSSIGSIVKSVASVGLTTKSISDRVRTSSSSGVSQRTSVSSSATVSIAASNSMGQTTSSVSTFPSSTLPTEVYGSSSHPMETTSVDSQTSMLTPSPKSSPVESSLVTTQTPPIKSAPSTTESPTTIQTISAGNDTIIVLPPEAVRRPFFTQNTGSTSVAMPTALPPADPTQHAIHIVKLAEIIVASVVGGSGLSITVPWSIWNFLRKRAEATGKVGAEVVREQSAALQRMSEISSLDLNSVPASWPQNVWTDLDRAADIENSILQEGVVDPEILTTTEAAQVEEVLTAPPPPSPPPGRNPPVNEPPSPPSGGDPPVNEPPSPPSRGDPPVNEPPSPPSGGDPPVNDRLSWPKLPENVELEFADKLRPMGKPRSFYQNGKMYRNARKVPGEYRDLSFGAKIFYASKYGENVWNENLIYSDYSSAAVGPDNQPLPKELILDSTGNIVSYHGISLRNMEDFGFPTRGSWQQQMLKLEDIKEYSYGLQKASHEEIERTFSRWRDEGTRKRKARAARKKKLNEGLAKLQKAYQQKNKEAAEEAAMEVDQEINELSCGLEDAPEVANGAPSSADPCAALGREGQARDPRRH